MDSRTRRITRCYSPDGIVLLAGSKKKIMNWTGFFVRGILLVISIAGLLYLAELSIPMGGLLVFLLSLSIGLTWLIANLLRDDDLLSSLFED